MKGKLFEKQKAEKEAALAKQEAVNQITIEYLRGLAEELDKLAASMSEEAGRTSSLEMWDSSRITRGQADMCRDLIKYMKGLSYKEYTYQLWANKL